MSPQVNGEVPNAAHGSAFIQHLMDYPVVSDGIHTFKSHELGQRSIALSDSAYKTFAVPVLPYFNKVYGYVSPYVTRADSLGEKTLEQLDERFPVVKKPTGELYADTKSLVFLPYNKAFEGRDHVLSVYSAEFKKNEQAGVVGYGKAAVSTAFVVSNETLAWLSSILSAKKAEAADAAQAVSEKINQ